MAFTLQIFGIVVKQDICSDKFISLQRTRLHLSADKRAHGTPSFPQTVPIIFHFILQTILTDQTFSGRKGNLLDCYSARRQLHVCVEYTCTPTNLVGRRWRYGYASVHRCPVHRETVETVEETCDWALTATSRSLWTTSAQRRCRLFPLHWQLGKNKDGRQVQTSWRPTCPTKTRSSVVWRSYVMTGHRSLHISVTSQNHLVSVHRKIITERNIGKEFSRLFRFRSWASLASI